MGEIFYRTLFIEAFYRHIDNVGPHEKVLSAIISTSFCLGLDRHDFSQCISHLEQISARRDLPEPIRRAARGLSNGTIDEVGVLEHLANELEAVESVKEQDTTATVGLAVGPNQEIILLDDEGELNPVNPGDTAWAALHVLKNEASGSPLPVEQLGRQIDTVLLTHQADARQQLPVGDQLDGDERFNRTQLIKGPRVKEPYPEDLKPIELINRIQATLRKALPGKRARRWRRIWLHWDRDQGTVTLERR